MNLPTEYRCRSLREPDGFALVEVLVSALLVGLISMLLTGVIAAGNTSGDLRQRSQADELAQQDQERLRGMSLQQLASLGSPGPSHTVALDGVTYTIQSNGRFLTSASGNASSCTTTGSSTADFVGIESIVTWPGNNRTPVKEQSVISPPAGGTILTQVADQSGNPLSGVRVTAQPTNTGTSATSAATTDSNGCTIFSGLAVGDYDLTATKSGYVDKTGDATPTTSATATAGNTATTNFTLGQAGAITASFKTTISGTTYSNQQTPSLSYNNPQMGTFGNTSVSNPASTITTPKTLYPFFTTSSTVFTNNYTAWAGKCASNQPPTNLATATVSPGATGTAASSVSLGAVLLPPVILKVSYKKIVGGVTTTTLVSPDHITLYNGCNSSFSSFEQWDAPVRGAGSAGSTDPTGSLGALSFPGQPYGSNYVVCVDDQGYRAYGGVSGTQLTNTNFAGTTWNVTIDSTSSSNAGLC